MPTECCVPLCTGRGGHRFPTAPGRYMAWKTAIRRGEKNWSPSKHAVVCKLHFAEDDYMGLTCSGTERLQRRLKCTAIPHIFPWQRALTDTQLQRKERFNKRELEREEEALALLSDIHNDFNVVSEEIIIDDVQDSASKEEPVTTYSDKGQQCGLTVQPRFSSSFFTQDPKGIHYYTGLEDYAKFLFVFSTLGSGVYHLQYYHGVAPTISILDQFFVTLMKLRQHLTNFAMSRMFDISENTVSNIFVTWINFLACQWDEIQWWPAQDVVHYFCPPDFKVKFPTTRVILDGTEFPVKQPKNPMLQQGTFSTYKNKNTAKVIVGATPGGLISYVSDAYGGSSSDRQIVERSNLMNICDAGDSIMVDKGFNIQDFFASANVTINIPSFFKNKNRMSGSCIMKDRKIASKRVHIERLIGLAKTYKILNSPLNTTELSLATEIAKVSFYLCNFRKCIVPKHA